MENHDLTNESVNPKSFTQLITFHNTTIIAIIMGIVTLIGKSYEEKRQEAAEIEQVINEKYDNIINREQELELEMKELPLQYNDAQNTELQEAETFYQGEVNKLKSEAEALSVVEKEKEKILAEAKSNDEMGGFASIILQISVLISSIGLTSKNKILTYIATGLTVLGVIIVLMMLF